MVKKDLDIRGVQIAYQKVTGHGTGFPGQRTWPHAAGAQEASGQHTQTQGLDLRWSCCMEPGVGLDGPYGSLPTQDTL